MNAVPESDQNSELIICMARVKTCKLEMFALISFCHIKHRVTVLKGLILISVNKRMLSKSESSVSPILPLQCILQPPFLTTVKREAQITPPVVFTSLTLVFLVKMDQCDLTALKLAQKHFSPPNSVSK